MTVSSFRQPSFNESAGDVFPIHNLMSTAARNLVSASDIPRLRCSQGPRSLCEHRRIPASDSRSLAFYTRFTNHGGDIAGAERKQTHAYDRLLFPLFAPRVLPASCSPCRCHAEPGHDERMGRRTHLPVDRTLLGAAGWR